MTRVCLVVLLAPLVEVAQGHPLTNLVPTRNQNQAALVTILSPCPTANLYLKVTIGMGSV